MAAEKVLAREIARGNRHRPGARNLEATLAMDKKRRASEEGKRAEPPQQPRLDEGTSSGSAMAPPRRAPAVVPPVAMPFPQPPSLAPVPALLPAIPAPTVPNAPEPELSNESLLDMLRDQHRQHHTEFGWTDSEERRAAQQLETQLLERGVSQADIDRATDFS
jgi:hypothetical protein